jgi:cytochrome c biogenesis protein CcmG/thiol:disulfide interchange protein DsbE
MRRLLPFVPLVVLAALAALFGLYGLHHDPKVNPAALVGQPLPGVSLPPLAGGPPQAMRTLVKGPAVVNVFASWCGPCAEEQPQLMALKAEGVPLIGVAYKDDPANTQAFLDRLGDPFDAVLADRSGDAGVEFGVSGVPETFLVDRRGMIVAKHTGPMTDDDVAKLAARVKALR